MGERTLGRREVLMGAGVAAGGVALTGLGAVPAAAKDGGDRHGRNDLSGSWLVTRADDPPGDPTNVKAVFSFAAGAVMVEHDIMPAAAPFSGTWEQRHGDQFKATIWSGVAGGPNGEPGPTIRVRLRGSQEHNEISGTYDFTVFDPLTEAVVDSGTGSFSGTPIEA